MKDGRSNQGSKNGEDWLPAEHGTATSTLRGPMARGLTWMLVDSWGAQLLGLVFFVVLARLLSESDFGLLALGQVFVLLASLVADQGLGDALVQRAALTRRQLDTAFWATLGAGLALAAATLLFADPLAQLIGQPQLGPVLQVLALAVVIAGLSSVQFALMRREMKFRQLATRRLAAILGAGVIGIMFAVAGAGVWALVAQQLSNAFIAAVVLWTVSPWRPSLSFSPADYRDLLRFGRPMLGSELLHFASRNVDNLIIGVFLGPVQLGLYAVAYRLLDTATQLMVNAAHKLAFPVFSTLQLQRERLRRAYVRITRALGLVTLPGYVGLALVAYEAVVVVFGERWAPAAEPAALLFLAGPVLTVQLLSGALLNAVGQPGVTLRIRLISTVVSVVGFLLAVIVFGSITAVAASFLIRAYLLLPLILFWLRRYAGVPWSAHTWELRTPLVATLVMAAAVVAVKVVLSALVGPAILLVAEVLTGIGVYAATVWLLDRALVVEVVTFARSALPSSRRPSPGSTVDA